MGLWELMGIGDYEGPACGGRVWEQGPVLPPPWPPSCLAPGAGPASAGTPAGRAGKPRPRWGPAGE